jgi:hypothetical protein
MERHLREVVTPQPMSEQRPTRDSMSHEETTISNMWEIAASVEVLERKGLCSKHDLHDIITEFRRLHPREDPLDVDD